MITPSQATWMQFHFWVPQLFVNIHVISKMLYQLMIPITHDRKPLETEEINSLILHLYKILLLLSVWSSLKNVHSIVILNRECVRSFMSQTDTTKLLSTFYKILQGKNYRNEEIKSVNRTKVWDTVPARNKPKSFYATSSRNIKQQRSLIN